MAGIALLQRHLILDKRRRDVDIDDNPRLRKGLLLNGVVQPWIPVVVSSRTLQFPCLYTATRQKIQDSPKTRDSLVNHLCLLSQTAPSTRIKRHRARRWGLGRRGLGWDWGKSQSPLADRARQQIIPPTRHPRLPLDARRTTVALLDNNLPPSALSPVRKVPERESADGARGGASERYRRGRSTWAEVT